MAGLADRVAGPPALALGPLLALDPEDRDLRLEAADVVLGRLVVLRAADLVLDLGDLFFEGRHRAPPPTRDGASYLSLPGARPAAGGR